MDPLKRMGGESPQKYELPPTEEGLINQALPFEIFTKIFSHLDDFDMGAAATVNKLWNRVSIDTVRQRKYPHIKKFIQFLVKNLSEESYSKQRKDLLDLLSDKKVSDSASLRQLKSSFQSIQDDIVNVLESFEEEDLKTLKKLYKKTNTPEFLINAFRSALLEIRMNKNIQESISLEGEPINQLFWCTMLMKASLAFALYGYFDKAILYAEKLLLIKDANLSDTHVIEVLDSVAENLYEYGYYDEALELGKRIPNHYQILNQPPFKIIVFAPNRYQILKQLSFKIMVFVNVAIEIAEKGDFDTVIKLVNSRPFKSELSNNELFNDKLFKDSLFLKASIALANNEDFDKALKSANLIDEIPIRAAALSGISQDLVLSEMNVSHPEYDHFLRYAIDTISKDLADDETPERMTETIFNIEDNYLSNVFIDSCVRNAQSISENHIKGIALNDIVDALIKNENFTTAIEVANSIPVKHIKGLALKDISKALAQEGNLDKAQEVANSIPDNHLKKLALDVIRKMK